MFFNALQTTKIERTTATGKDKEEGASEQQQLQQQQQQVQQQAPPHLYDNAAGYYNGNM
jgi:hypothetical protein